MLLYFQLTFPILTISARLSYCRAVLETYDEEGPHPHCVYSQYRKTNAIERIIWNLVNWFQHPLLFPSVNLCVHYFHGFFPPSSICLNLSYILWRLPKENIFLSFWYFLLPSASLKLCSKLTPNYELSCFHCSNCLIWFSHIAPTDGNFFEVQAPPQCLEGTQLMLANWWLIKIKCLLQFSWPKFPAFKAKLKRLASELIF